MDIPSDQEVIKTVKKMLFPIVSNSFKAFDHLVKDIKPIFTSRRDELFHRLLNGWNIEREQNGFKKIGAARLASAIKRNPFLKNDDGELELLIKECEAKGNYKKAHFILFK